MARSIVSGFLAGIVGALVVVLVAPGSVAPLRPAQQSFEGRLPVSERAQDHEQAVTSAVMAAEPAVVSIVLTADVAVVEQFFPDNPFEDFFFQFPTQRDLGTQELEVGGGSGFLISPDGMIITNRHVVDRDDVEYAVFTSDGRKHEARVVARDPALDLAVVRIDGSGFPFLQLGDSDELQIGQTAIAIGNALAEFRNTVSVGVISGLARSIVAGSGFGQGELLEEVIQTDAAINPGNSGGPLVNLAAEVIAVNVAVAQGSENIGFAIPVNEVRAIVDSVNQSGRIVRPFLGVRHRVITPEFAGAQNLPVDYGALIVRGNTPDELAVTPGSAADRAGVVENDILLEIDGVRIDESNSLASLIRRKQVGQMVRLKWLHDGAEQEASVELGEVPG